MTEEKKPEDVEPAELEAYFDAADGAGPSREERVQYLRARLDQINAQYKTLVLEREEMIDTKREDVLVQINKIGRENFLARKRTVKALRALGETVDDKFVRAG